MASSIQRRRGTTSDHATFTGAVGEITIDTTKDTVVVHDGAVVGGVPLLREDGSNSSLALGSQGTPSLKWDANTGIYSPGEDQLAVATNGTGRLFVDASGNVGVGTASITAAAGTKLQLESAGSTRLNITANASAYAAIDFGDSADRDAGRIEYYNIIDSMLFHTAASERLRITSAGLVGIGTSSPTHNLTIGSSAPSDFVLSLRGGVGGFLGWDDSANCTILQAPNTRSLQFRVNSDTFSAGTMAMHINSSGNVGIGTSSPSGNLHVYNPATTSADIYLENTDGYYNFKLNNQNLDIFEGATSRLRISSGGNVGIGTTSPGTTLDVAGNVFVGAKDTSNAIVEVGNGATGNRNAIIDLVGDTTYSDFALRIIRSNGGANAVSSLTHRGTGNFTIATNEAAPITFNTTASERARIDSSGRLLVGTSTARSVGGLTNQVQVEGVNAGTYSQSWVRNVAGTGGATIFLGKSRSGSVGGVTIVNTADQLGGLYFVGADGVDLNTPGASIEAYVDGTPGADDMPGRLVFSTTADGAASPTERLRITSAGQIQAGGLGTAAAPVLSFFSDPNTGIYSPGADQLAVATNGVGRLFVDASGNVGVGAAANANGVLRLNVSSGNNANLVFSENNTDRYILGQVTGDNALRVYNLVTASERLRITSAGLVGVGTSAPNYQLHVTTDFAVGASGFNQQLTFSNDTIQSLLLGTGYTPLKLNPLGGNVGIGTSSPASTLHVAGTFRNTGQAFLGIGEATTLAYIGDPFTTNTRSIIFNRATGVTDIVNIQGLNAGVGLTDIALQAGGGNVGIGTTSPSAKLEVVGGNIRLDNNQGVEWGGANNFIYGNDSTDFVAIATNGTERARIDSSGRLGIGTSLPRSLLDCKNTHAYGTAAQDVVRITPNFSGGSTSSASSMGAITWGYDDGTTNLGRINVVANQPSTTNASSMQFWIHNGSSFSQSATLTPTGLGIGTTSPSTTLSIGASASSSYGGGVCLNRGPSTYNFYEASDGTNSVIFGLDNTLPVAKIGSVNSYPIGFFTGNAERARIDSSGRLLVGTSTATNNVRLDQKIAAVGGPTAPGGISLTSYAGASAGNRPILDIQKSRGSTDGSMTLVASGDLVGTINFRGADGSGFVSAAGIDACVDGTPGANDMPGRLVFSTTADGASSPTERMRINSSGQILAGALGTAALPIISFLNDPNTGIYSPGADQLAVATNGVARMSVAANGDVTFNHSIDLPNVNTYIKGGGHNVIQVDATRTYFYGGTNGVQLRTADNISDLINITNAGLVGIGTSSPGFITHISTGDASSITAPTAGSFGLYIQQNTSGSKGGLCIQDGASNSGPALKVVDNTNSTRFIIDADGSVGIGTSSPAYQLQVNAASDAVLSTSNSSSVTSGNRGTIAHLNSANSTCGMFRFAAVTDNVGTEIQFHTRPAAGSLTQSMTLDSTGRLGIGTTAPQTLLQVGDSTTGNGVPRIRVHRGAGSDYFEIDCTTGGTTLDTVGGGPFQISMGGSSAVYVDPSRRLLVGTSSATGVNSNVASVLAGNFMSFQGSVSASTSTATTLFALENLNATYMVTAVITGTANAGAYHSVYVVGSVVTNSHSIQALKAGSLLTLSLSGANVQATQTSGITQTITWSVTRMANL